MSIPMYFIFTQNNKSEKNIKEIKNKDKPS